MDIILTVNTSQRSISGNSSSAELMSRIKYIGESGYNCIRVNFKQFTESECDRTFTVLNAILAMKDYFHKPIKIYIDIPFPYEKFRVQFREKKREIKKNELITIVSNSSNELDEIMIDTDFFSELYVGQNITYADGEGILKIVQVESQYVKAVSADDFEMYNGKSLYGGNLKEGTLSKEFIDFLSILHQMDIVEGFLFSFCNLGTIKDTFLSYFKDIPQNKYFAKIESNEGVANIDSIIESFDGIVIARGDLAITCGTKNFYKYHNYLAQKVVNSDKKLIFATDIMTSLGDKRIMSRADLIDMSNMLLFNPNALIINSNIVLKQRLEILRENLEELIK